MSKKIVVVAFILAAVLVLTGCAQSILPGTTWKTDYYIAGDVYFDKNGILTYTYDTVDYGSGTVKGTWLASGNRLRLDFTVKNINISNYYTTRIFGKFMYLYDDNWNLASTWAKKS